MSMYQPERLPVPTPWRLRRELRLRRPPWWLVLPVIVLPVVGLGILGLIWHARHSTSSKPRVHLIQDMDVQPRYGPQAASAVFADGRAMRMPVAGTVSRNGLEESDHYDRGFTQGKDAATGQPALIFFKGLPPQVKQNETTLRRGRMLFGIYCAPCHGASGDGHGPVNEQALRTGESKWVPATSLLSPEVRDREEGHLYNTIRNGIRNMPPYGSQVQTRDRWAIVAYVRQLQSQAPAAPSTRPAAP